MSPLQQLAPVHPEPGPGRERFRVHHLRFGFQESALEAPTCELPVVEAPAVPDRLLGRRLGRDGSIRIDRCLGRGGMGTVYQGFDESTQGKVAIKFLIDDGPRGSEAANRFRREGDGFGRLRHPNLIRVFAYGHNEGRPYLVTEYVEGRNLYEVLRDEGVFPVHRALEVTRAIALGLAEAHRHRVVHRDLKPENVMMRTSDAMVKVIDFGIARDLDASRTFTPDHAYVGTPAYSAPEQIQGDRVDARADIFSLGVILYELLTGRIAFEGRHTLEVLKATLHETPSPVESLNATVTYPLAKLIGRMIEKKPRHRPREMHEVIAEIDRLANASHASRGTGEDGGVRAILKHLFEGWRRLTIRA